MQMTSDYPDIFLSYSREDQAVARRFAEALQREGFHVWWDQALSPGEAFDEVTEQALEKAKAVVVLWSKTSVASRWVRSEATQAHANGRLVPVMIEACKRPIMFELTQTLELSGWNGNADDRNWQTLVAALRGRTGRKAPAEQPAAAPAPGPASPVAEKHPGPWRRPVVAVAAGALLALFAAGAWWMTGREAGRSVAPAPAAPTATVPSRAASVAVMPFANLTGDAGMEYFGDGLAEELLNALGKISGLRVPPRTSSFSFKGRDEDIRQIAGSLGVDAVLEGSVRSAGETIRLTARLADGRTGEQIWSEVYERPFRDIFRLQDELTRSIVAQMRTHLRADIVAPEPARLPTTDLQAYRLYLQALALTRKGGRAQMEESIRLLDQAIARDGNFAQAYGAQTGPKSLLYLRGYGGTVEMVHEAEKDAVRALQLDPDLIETRGSLAFFQANRGEWIEARANLDRVRDSGRAADLFPHVGFVVTAMGHLGWTDSVVREVASQPVADPSAALQLAMQSFVLGRTTAAHENMELALALGFLPDVPPVPAVRSMIAVRERQFGEAADLAAAGLSPGLRALDAEPVIRQVIAALADPPARAEASAALRQLTERAGVGGMIQMENVMTLIWQTQLGNLDAAFSWADRFAESYRSGMIGRGILYWMWIEEMRPFREDPRFQQFTAKLGLLDYWRKRGAPDLCTLERDELNCH